MAWIYFQELEEQPSPCPDTSDPLPIAKLSRPPKQCSSRGWPQATSPQPQSGMTYQRYEAATCPTELTSSLVDSHARILALRAMEQAWQESEAAFFMKSQGCVASLSHDSSFWKMSQPSLLEAEPKWLEPLPRWGMTVDGALYPLRPLERHTSGSGGGYLPTPTAQMGEYNKSPNSDKKRLTLVGMARKNQWPIPTAQDFKRRGPNSKQQGISNLPPVGTSLNPQFLEWLMGYPIGHTEYEDWAMRGCQSKPAKHLNC